MAMLPFFPAVGDVEFSLEKNSDGVILHVVGCGECAESEADLDWQILIDHRDLESLEAWIREARS